MMCLRATGAVEVVPGAESALLFLDDQQALAREHEKAFLRVLGVVHAHRLAGLEHADVDPELGEPPLALEGAVGAERPFVLPP